MATTLIFHHNPGSLQYLVATTITAPIKEIEEATAVVPRNSFPTSATCHPKGKSAEQQKIYEWKKHGLKAIACFDIGIVKGHA